MLSEPYVRVRSEPYVRLHIFSSVRVAEWPTIGE